MRQEAKAIFQAVKDDDYATVDLLWGTLLPPAYIVTHRDIHGGNNFRE